MGCKNMFRSALALTVPGVGSSSVTVQKSRVAWLALSLSWILASGCSERASARDEADALMTSLNAVSDEAGFVERTAALERLGQLQLHFAPHAQARDVCSAAHKGLLDAEIAQTEARRALSTAAEGSAQPTLEPTAAQKIAADIERSNQALATAKQRFPECERAMRGLIQSAR
jgi:hypothetical protein